MVMELVLLVLHDVLEVQLLEMVEELVVMELLEFVLLEFVLLELVLFVLLDLARKKGLEHLNIFQMEDHLEITHYLDHSILAGFLDSLVVHPLVFFVCLQHLKGQRLLLDDPLFLFFCLRVGYFQLVDLPLCVKGIEREHLSLQLRLRLLPPIHQQIVFQVRHLP